MSKKIASYEELLKKAKECEELIKIRKKWEAEGNNLVDIKIGVKVGSLKSKKLADEVAMAIIGFLKEEKIEGVAVYEKEFNGYSGDNPTMEILIHNSGNVIFGDMTPEKAVETASRYLKNLDEYKVFFTENDGSRSCNCH